MQNALAFRPIASAVAKAAAAVMAVVFAALMIAGLPQQALADTLPAGKYTIEGELIGGSGRANIQSPIDLTVEEDGTMTATIVWSSSNYDLMVVAGVDLKPTTTQPASTFQVPVESLDDPLGFSAETTAMSEAHMIEYEIEFDQGTLTPVDDSKLEAASPQDKPAAGQQQAGAPAMAIDSSSLMIGIVLLLIVVASGLMAYLFLRPR